MQSLPNIQQKTAWTAFNKKPLRKGLSLSPNRLMHVHISTNFYVAGLGVPKLAKKRYFQFINGSSFYQ
ncbi:hypothetical protein TCARB_0956 [Thermofilum adornatum 1505]|uniref:Uncharacterized protein n=1 Tax=Thermofilum adornatum 1505 TaxID=697581 RepID=A0A3G1A5F0_9CREN|nr:hypothetical protein TCARB_0956 [Thermofilum adornatum 1505]